jgi:glycosyltransferase involved in cell wall biosynthesis
VPPTSRFTVVIPAFNEETCLPATLAAVARSATAIRDQLAVDVIVVDNNSTDRTAEVALRHGARIVKEPEHNIGKVRNTGARAAAGDALVFLDADTLIPETLLTAIDRALKNEACIGGAVAVGYAPLERRWMRWYLAGWAFWGRLFNMKQGAAQFCRTSAFEAVGGYDETIYMGEDIHFYWRLARYARRHGLVVTFIDSPAVTTSSRRFDRMSLWRALVLTHPLVIWMTWKRRGMWKDWYDRPVR